MKKNAIERKDLGLYVHIPFCVKKCDYCDFLSKPADEDTKKQYVAALCKEIYAYKEFAQDYLVKTIFIGGGTPSCLAAEDIELVMNAISEVFQIYGWTDKESKKTLLEKFPFKFGKQKKEELYINDTLEESNVVPFSEEMAEITMEVNPGTLTKEKLQAIKNAGINRLSFGLQSTNNDELKVLGRIHTYEEFLENYYLAREVGFSNINIDLMSALPNQSLESFRDTLNKITALKPEHISAYSLIIEEGTPFYDRYGNEKSDQLPSEEEDRAIYELTKQILKEHGFIKYEISNYAKPGFECKHNSSYWKRTSYLGLGLGASSLMDNARFCNVSDLETYLRDSFDYHLIRRDVERLVQSQQMEEFMFLGLRMMEGIKKSNFKEQFGVSIETIYGDVFNKLSKEELLIVAGDDIRLTDKGIDLSNYVFAQFLLDDFVRS